MDRAQWCVRHAVCLTNPPRTRLSPIHDLLRLAGHLYHQHCLGKSASESLQRGTTASETVETSPCPTCRRPLLSASELPSRALPVHALTGAASTSLQVVTTATNASDRSSSPRTPPSTHARSKLRKARPTRAGGQNENAMPHSSSSERQNRSVAARNLRARSQGLRLPLRELSSSWHELSSG